MTKQDVDTPHPDPAIYPLPAWVRPKALTYEMVDAAFLAGAALARLDLIVPSEVPWLGAWRQRLAVQAGVACVRLLGRREDEQALRDAYCLCRPGDALGPAGTVFKAWKDLANRSPGISGEALIKAAAAFGLKLEAGEGRDLAERAHLLIEDALTPLQAASAMIGLLTARRHGTRADHLVLGFWLADQALALKMRWPRSMPLIARDIHHASLKRGVERRRPRPGEDGFPATIAMAISLSAASANDLAATMARSADKLQAVQVKLRAKGADGAVAMLLNDDAISATQAEAHLSDRGARRFFDRLVALGAIRELSGRPTFRLYGL